MILTAFTLSASADSFEQRVKNIPLSLQEWIPWVFKDQPEIHCPILYNNNKHFCAYPGQLSIHIKNNSGSFVQEWESYAQSFIPLPGDNKNWPQNIRVNEQYHPVISRNNKPYIQLQKGHYNITGDFYWQQQPKYLSIPATTGLINLSVNNEAVNMADFRKGKLWLKTSQQSNLENNHLDLHVFRKLTDSIPFKIDTMIKLDVSGQQREIIIQGALLQGFVASAVNSKLPAQIDKQGNLKIQVRAGQWQISLSSIHSSEIHSISLNQFKKPWPGNEIWVLDQQPHLRRINVIAKTSIDAKQTQLPKAWKKYPAFQMNSGEQLSFSIIKRGNPEPQPDQLKLTKKIWLDFDGKGLTVNDKITGKLSQQWRMNAADDVKLGQVTLNGEPQYITLSAENRQGVEVRHGNINLSSDSRIEAQNGTFSSSGWDINFNHVDASLYLPAGWKLFSLSGANASGTWIKKWTLLDLFIVLITAISVFKLWGIPWGIITLISLVLSWHQANAPQYIWINLIIATALLHALPETGRIYTLIRNYRYYLLIFLAILILPFIIHQARTALYPQLEFSNIGHQYQQATISKSSSSDKASRLRKMDFYSTISESYAPEEKNRIAPQKMAAIDPDAMIQTGPGLPSWTLTQYHIYWDGPVSSQQNISLILISPAMNSLLNVLRIFFILLLSWRLLDISVTQIKKMRDNQFPKSPEQTLSLSAGLLVAGLFFLSPQTAEASFPTKALLEELKTELSQSTQCLPHCASIESTTINLSEKQLSLRLFVHAQQDISIPLPIPIKQWMPDSIIIDGEPAAGLFRQNSPVLWMFVSQGSHTIEISGSINHLRQLQINFPLKPHHLDLQVEGWSSEGMDEDITRVSALSFLKLSNNQTALSTIGQSDIPVFARMTRTLNLGQSWHLNTLIQGISGSAYPIIFKIPLLAGESVLSDNIKVKNKHAIITLQHKNSRVQWHSKLLISDQIKLRAIHSKQIIEQWILNTSPIWHVEHSGIPVVYHQRHGDLWQPRWQPWSGEEVLIDISRPKGIKGKTLTIDSSTLSITPGEQNTSSVLEFNLRSSLGGQHNIVLPDNAILQSVTINNKAMPIRNTQQGLSLPVLPGNQAVKVSWNEPRGVSGLFHTSAVNLGSDSVNNKITVKPGANRWILLTTGPAMGPAVLFWGVFFIILILSYALGRIKGTPLNTLQWILLWIGLSASEPLSAIIIVACIFALRIRSTIDVASMKALTFNLFQLLLIILVISSVSALIASIQQGLLGSPNMQISGNGSSAYQLNWFSDRISEILPQATMISVPVYIYRLIMLLWSIWLAFAVIKWAQWGWAAFSHQQYWRKLPLRKKSQKTSNIWGKQEKEKPLNDSNDISTET